MRKKRFPAVLVPGSNGLYRRVLPDVGRLREVFSYDKLTGDLTYLIKTGSVSPTGRVLRRQHKVGLDGNYYWVSRIIWKLVTGDEPPLIIDHEDGDHLNFVWTNMRESDYTRNSQNRAFRQDSSTTGHKGVRLNSDRPGGKPYVADLTVNRRWINLGGFNPIAEAVDARRAAEIKYFGEYRTDRVMSSA